MLRVTVRGYTGGTPYARVGNYLVVGLALVVLVAQLAVARAAARRRAA
jgi:apolipoprotein N-acyltransferase